MFSCGATEHSEQFECLDIQSVVLRPHGDTGDNHFDVLIVELAFRSQLYEVLIEVWRNRVIVIHYPCHEFNYEQYFRLIVADRSDQR